MNRSLARLAATLLVGVSIAACSSLDGSESGKSAASSSVSPGKQAKSLASDIDAQVRNAQVLRAQGDYAGATKILAQLTLVAPDNANVVGEYGKSLVQQGRPRDALDFLNRAVQLQPGDWTLYSAMGVAYDQNGEYSKARNAYQQALSMKPGNPGVLNNYALSRMQAGDLATAHQLMAQASAVASTDPKIARNVALLASLTPAQSAQSRTAAAPTAAKGGAPRATATVSNGSVVMQQVPADSKAGPVIPANKAAATKVATGAPHPIVKETATSVAQTTPPAKAATAKVVATKVAKEDPKKAAKDKTPSLRMTADVTAP
jgi:Flp pilus assembly protein TadD